MRQLFALITIALLALTSCDSCFNVECDTPDVNNINGLHFEFDKNSFELGEVNEAYILRFNPGKLETPIDTLYLAISDSSRAFSITMNTFGNAVDFADFDYGIYVNSSEYAYRVSNIATNGHYPTDCCCCYRNKEKTFFLNGDSKDRTNSIEPLVLTK